MPKGGATVTYSYAFSRGIESARDALYITGGQNQKSTMILGEMNWSPNSDGLHMAKFAFTFIAELGVFATVLQQDVGNFHSCAFQFSTVRRKLEMRRWIVSRHPSTFWFVAWESSVIVSMAMPFCHLQSFEKLW